MEKDKQQTEAEESSLCSNLKKQLDKSMQIIAKMVLGKINDRLVH